MKVNVTTKKLNQINVIIINFIFYMHGVVVIPHYLDLAEGKQDFSFGWKMTQSESDKVNATQDGIGTTEIKLICLLCRKVPKIEMLLFPPKIRDATNLSNICCMCHVNKL